MDGGNVYDRVTREHPELTGRDRLLAIKALKQQQKAERRRAKNAGRECPACQEVVKPEGPNALAALSVLVVLLVLSSLAASLVAAVHTFSDATVHGGWNLVLWPVAVARDGGWAHPRAFAVLFAFLASMAAAWVSGKLGERADRRARCPECNHPMPPAPPA